MTGLVPQDISAERIFNLKIHIKGGRNLNSLRKIKRVCVSILSCALFFLLALPPLTIRVAASSEPEPPSELDGAAVCLYDVTHSRFLVCENKDEVLNTSTSAKVMMGLIACEMLSERLNETVLITEEMLSGVSGYSMNLTAGDKIKVEDLLYGAICASYNDAAYALAHLCAESTEGFVSLMNKRALELGATSTNYTNPIGFPDNSAMVTTLSDTLKIALVAAENELYMTISSALKHDISANSTSERRTVYNRNYLISSRSNASYFNSGCQGMNAGNSGEDGGWSIITKASDDGADYICIVLGGTESENGSSIYAYETVNTLLDWAFASYNNYLIFNKGEEIGQAKIKLTTFGSSSVPYSVGEDFAVYIPNNSSPNISYTIHLDEKLLKAPIDAGDEIGIVKVYCNGKLVGQSPLVISESCEASPIMLAINGVGEYTRSRAFIATVICFVILLTVSFITIRRKQYLNSGYTRKY